MTVNYKIRDRDDHLKNDRRPKRILALDGGGIRGALTLADGRNRKVNITYCAI